ncbi:MAG TPA: hypothetical protein PK098_09275 [Phycisphaerales bacterium]|nr:hypothetical protein [Phycisphaerales bacterium]
MGLEIPAIGMLLLAVAGLVAFILLIVFILVPIFRGVGWTIAAIFRAIGWFIAHIFEFIGGMVGDVLRLIGAVVPVLIFSPLAVLNVIIGRWSAAGHFAESVRREFMVAGACLYRIVLRRPLKLFWLHGILEGVEQRVPEAMLAAPGSDKPSRLTGQFEGYTIVGSLRAGGSGGKLYIARPDDAKRGKLAGFPEHVVIKSFTLTEGSSLPQIVRESRALECAKQLGHVLDHGMDEHRFFYVMPYHPGDHLGIVARQLHGETDGRGLAKRQLTQVLSYTKDLVSTLSLYHRGGLWHKDVKPENIIVHDGRAHLVDLGLVTPLKSAMTLTTHGTEYFRDPEMVRQALRGVKVHQVNGAKFDIYAAGAVLYFLLENTFPAHGGLSRFTHQSPEALRWIVRRSMTEYHQRYETAEAMLVDLEAVASASDPFAVKPAELPSMRSGGKPADFIVETESPQAQHAAFAASAPLPAAQPVATPSGRPRLRVINWWTGAYVAADDAPAQARVHVPPVAHTVHQGGKRRTAREQLVAARHRADEMRRRVIEHRQKVGLERQPSGWLVASVVGVVIAVTAAVVFPTMMYRQVGIADASIVNGAVTAGASGQTGVARPLVLVMEPADAPTESSAVADIIRSAEKQGYTVIVPHTGVALHEVGKLLEQWRTSRDQAVSEQVERMLAEHDLYGFLQVRLTSTGAVPTYVRSSRPGAELRKGSMPLPIAPAPELPYLVINDHPSKSDPRVQLKIAQALTAYADRGWTVVSDIDLEGAARAVMPAGTSFTEFPARLEALLDQNSLGGLLHIIAPVGDGDTANRLAIRELARRN